ncbi:hypothetical protein M5W88_27195, partial [Paenibacillus thiaminolyticus]|uniref:hypothetical protein n=1 Tax=Paenibacillus thiaminolyticus TaxID=49283 RepID=UPI00227E3331
PYLNDIVHSGGLFLLSLHASQAVLRYGDPVPLCVKESRILPDMSEYSSFQLFDVTVGSLCSF